jgi:hypothetical protein
MPRPKLTRDVLRRRISELPGASMLQAYYVDTEDGEPEPGADFCFEHAKELVATLAKEGTEAWACSQWSESDNSKRCATCTCPLHAGGLSKYGVASALGLTETDPKACHVYVSELEDAANSMRETDPRWDLWEFHARRVLKNRQVR